MSAERLASMKAYGAEIILTPAAKSMEGAIDLALDVGHAPAIVGQVIDHGLPGFGRQGLFAAATHGADGQDACQWDRNSSKCGLFSAFRVSRTSWHSLSYSDAVRVPLISSKRR